MAIAKPQKPMRKGDVEFYPMTDSTQVICDENGTRLSDVLQTLSPSGTITYAQLQDKPQIEGVTLSGNKSFPQLNLSPLTNTEIENLLT